jgi:hypothetical protein
MVAAILNRDVLQCFAQSNIFVFVSFRHRLTYLL